jgi:hypothetical protein
LPSAGYHVANESSDREGTEAVLAAVILLYFAEGKNDLHSADGSDEDDGEGAADMDADR